MNKIILFPLLLVLGSCASDYIPPNPNADIPKHWLGDAKIITISNAPRNMLGVKKIGDIIFEDWEDASRKGILKEEIKYKSAFGKEIVIPAETLLHGEQLTVSQTTRYAGVTTNEINLNEKINPIEWCFKVPKQATCIFWENEKRARYIDMYPMSQRIFFGFNPQGTIGPIPKIEEKSVDFGGPIRLYQKIDKLDNEGIIISSYIKDGNEDEKLISKGKAINWAGDKSVNYEKYVISPIKDASGNISAAEISITKKD